MTDTQMRIRHDDLRDSTLPKAVRDYGPVAFSEPTALAKVTLQSAKHNRFWKVADERIF